MADLLRDDPSVFLPASKELHFFSRDAEPLTAEGLRMYEQNFDRAAPGELCGEATPGYLRSRFAAKKVRSYIPEVRLLILVRDPIARALSAFLHAQRMRIFPKSMTFDDAVERDARQHGARWTSIVSDGYYDIGLSRWLDQFPREQIHIVPLELLRTNYDHEMGAIYTHLNLEFPSAEPPPFPHVNEARHQVLPQVNRLIVHKFPVGHPIRRGLDRPSRKLVDRPTPSTRTTTMLRELYAERIQQLESLASLDLAIWPTHPQFLMEPKDET